MIAEAPSRCLLSIGALLVSLAGCHGRDAEPAVSGHLKVFGDETGMMVVVPIADKFRDKNPALNLETEESSSAWAIGYTKQGMVDVGVSTRKPSADDGLVVRPIARDGLTMIVNAENPVGVLTNEQIVGIYTGKITNWKDVGGKDAPITMINHAEVRTTLGLFVEYLKISTGDIKYADIVVSSDAEAVKHVAAKTDAVTYTSIAAALGAQAAGKPLKLVGFGGVEPTVENVAAGKVPVVYDVSLLTKGEPDKAKKAFIDYASSADVREIVKSHHFAPPAGA
jgi:phosphate transport system substrate-binding protein